MVELTKPKKIFTKDEEVFLKGKIKWCKHLRPDTTYPPGKWSVIMYITGDELEKVRKWQAQGIKNAVKFDEADGWYITLSRKVSITVKGREVGLPCRHYAIDRGPVQQRYKHPGLRQRRRTWRLR